MEPLTINYDVNSLLNQLVEFIRLYPDPNDCVINAMQVLGVVDVKQAGIMRTISPCCPGGLVPNQITQILETIYPMYKFNFSLLK